DELSRHLRALLLEAEFHGAAAHVRSLPRARPEAGDVDARRAHAACAAGGESGGEAGGGEEQGEPAGGPHAPSAETGGRRHAQGRAASSCAASRKSVASSPKRPTQWVPMGRFSAFQ